MHSPHTQSLSGLMKPLPLLFLGLSLCALQTSARPPGQANRGNLLLASSPAGGTRQIESVTDWQQQRSSILEGMQEVMGPLPGPEKKSPLEVRVEEEVDCGDHLQRLITYQSEPSGRVPAYLLIPKSALVPSAKPHPAVLCLHPTNNEIGAKVVLGLGKLPNRAYALELTQRGFVTLAPAYPHLADYAPDLEKLGYQSGTMKAIWDNIRGIDLLESLPYVKRDGFGAIGHSLGGHNAIFTAVFEPRIRVIVSSCGFDSFLDYYSADPKVWQPGKGWTQHRYMPRLANYAGRLQEIPFDFHELIAALAPRHVFVNAPTGDTNFQWQSVDRIVAAAKPVFKLHNAEGRLKVVHPDSSHDFPQSARERAYQLLEKQLR